jgi:hypothetical protein
LLTTIQRGEKKKKIQRFIHSLWDVKD